MNFQQLRERASDWIRTHAEEYRPFMVGKEEELISDEQFEEYCTQIVNEPVWGGNLELQALSQSLEISINVIQSDNCVVIGEEFAKKIYISYHRHEYGLGEHYNSLVT